MSNEIILKIRGKSFKGWTSVVVEKSLYQMAGAFGLGATDIYPGDAERWDLAMGDECQVEIDGQVVVTGYVEDIPIDYDASSHNIQIGGRDKTGDLVDCSFIMKKNEWKSRKVIDIIKALCSPYGIEVVVHNSIAQKASQRANQALFPVITKTDEKEDSVKVEEGDTVFEAISKICKVHAILPVSYGDGKLTLTQAGTSQAYDSLELGKNVKLGSLDQSNRDRYQTYICKAQSAGFDWMTTADFVSPKGQITDDVIMRYRPLVILLEKGGEQGSVRIELSGKCLLVLEILVLLNIMSRDGYKVMEKFGL